MEVVVAVSDLHAGSTIALCPPEGLELDDGGWYAPSLAQKWLWDCWTDAWDQVKRLVGRGRLHIVLNGDLIDGDHHRTPQIASPLTGIHMRCAMECLQVPLALKPDSVLVTRGTESHVGRSGETEEGIARVLKAEGHRVIEDQDTGTKSAFHHRFDVNGWRFDARHHGRMGMRSYTKASYHRLYAFDVWAEHSMDNVRPPDIAIRSHHHQFMDSGAIPRVPTRVVTTPAWQLMSAYGHRLSIESLADIGLVAFVVDDDHVDVRPILYKPSRPTVNEL